MRGRLGVGECMSAVVCMGSGEAAGVTGAALAVWIHRGICCLAWVEWKKTDERVVLMNWTASDGHDLGSWCEGMLKWGR